MSQALESPAEGILRLKQATTNRSSALFYARTAQGFETVVTFLNHFLIKRRIPSVRAEICLRDTVGNTVEKRTLAVEEPRVYEIKLSELTSGPFEGSVEIVFESEENLSVPFTAVTALYRSLNGFCQIHSYTRRYNPDELGTQAVIDVGVETGWPLSSADLADPFFVLHGGDCDVTDEVSVTVWNARGERKDLVRTFDRPAFGTRVLSLKQDFGVDAAEFLHGRDGYGTIRFTPNGTFPRLLCGNRRMSGEIPTDLQATHSNFDFSSIAQPRLQAGAQAWCPIPGHVEGGKSALTVYPGLAAEQTLTGHSKTETMLLRVGSTMRFEGRAHDTVDFRVADGEELPCRVLLGLQVQGGDGALPGECSYGAITTELAAVAKKFFWGFAMGDGEEGWLSGFSRPIADGATPPPVQLYLYDTDGNCGAASIEWERFAHGPLRIADFLSRPAKGSVFYVCVALEAIAWFMCYAFDPKRGSGGIEHSY